MKNNLLLGISGWMMRVCHLDPLPHLILNHFHKALFDEAMSDDTTICFKPTSMHSFMISIMIAMLFPIYTVSCKMVSNRLLFAS